MVYYGAWEQGADYTRPFPYLYNQVQAPFGDTTTTIPDPAPPYDEDLNTALNAATTDTTFATGPGIALGIESVALTVPSLTMVARKTEGGGEWTAADLLDLAYYDAMMQANMPAGAYGVEYETATVTPVAANLHLEVGATGTDSTAPPGTSQTAFNVALTMSILAGRTYGTASTPLVDVGLGPGMTPVLLDLDLTSHMGVAGECAISTIGSKIAPWGYFDPTQAGLIRLGTSLGNGTQMVYTLHPPRHRWLYETPPATLGLPPLRQSPRDDNLGTASAARIWPSSSQQNSLRRLGYY